MKIEEVPQDRIRTLGGRLKSLYAQDEEGRYHRIETSGWEVEEIVLDDVLEDYETQASHALEEVRRGTRSPIAYFMHKLHMDPPTLALAVGYRAWRVKRHLRPEVFRKLPDRVLLRYADLFQITTEILKNLGSP